MQIDQEFVGIKTWSQVNKIPINRKKTKELTIAKEKYVDKITPLEGVKRVTEAKLLGVL